MYEILCQEEFNDGAHVPDHSESVPDLLLRLRWVWRI
jgi:hypothetical protein